MRVFAEVQIRRLTFESRILEMHPLSTSSVAQQGADIMTTSNVQFLIEDGVHVAVLGTEYDNLDTPSIENAAKQLLELAQAANPPLVVIDMAATKFFGSAFLGVLFRMWRRLTARGGRLVTCNATGICAQVLSVTQVDKLWLLCNSRASAVRSIKGTS